MEPTYQYFQSRLTEKTAGTFGGLFANASYILSFDVNSAMKISVSDDSEVYNTIDMRPRRNLAFGFGCKYLDRYSMEARLYIQN